MLGALLVVVAFAFALVGSLLVLRRFRRAPGEKIALAARVAALRPFAEGAVGEEVKVEGIVSLLDNAFVQGPVVERPGVWVEAEVLEEPDPDSASRSLARVRAAVPFSVSGVRVHAPNGPMEWPLTSLVTQRESPPAPTLPARERAFFASHGAVIDELFNQGRRRVFRERCLMPGVAVLVIGTKVRGAAPLPPGGYRDVRDPPFELTGSAFYESEAVVARGAEPAAWSGAHTVIFGIAFVSLASFFGGVGYAVLLLMTLGR